MQRRERYTQYIYIVQSVLNIIRLLEVCQEIWYHNIGTKLWENTWTTGLDTTTD